MADIVQNEILAWNEFIDQQGYRALVNKVRLLPLRCTLAMWYHLSGWKRLWNLVKQGVPFPYAYEENGALAVDSTIMAPCIRSFFTDPVNMTIIRSQLRQLLDEKKLTAARVTLYSIVTLLRLADAAEPLCDIIGRLSCAVHRQEVALRELQTRKMDGFVNWAEVVETCESIIADYDLYYRSLHLDKDTKYRAHHLLYLLAHFLTLMPPMRRKPLINTYITTAPLALQRDLPGNYLYMTRGDCNKPLYTLVIQDDKQCNLRRYAATCKDAGKVATEVPMGPQLSEVIHKSFGAFPRKYLFQQDLRTTAPVKPSFFDKLLRQCTGMTTNLIRASFSTYWRCHTDGKCDLQLLAQQMRTSTQELRDHYLRTMDYYGRELMKDDV